ncbi:MAG: prepilin-type N-terminal cleavage/methylation domain-containing protein [Candidatus Omnitrophota bacterium]
MFLFRKKSFSLLELIVASVLIGIGIAGVAGVLTSGLYFLKRAENKARAMSLAYRKKESLMTKSYETLTIGKDSGKEDRYRWTTEVREFDEGGIPWKKVEVEVNYPETTMGSGQDQATKKVFLTNLSVYPYVHSETQVIDSICNTGSCVVANGVKKVIGSSSRQLSIDIDYPVDKQILVSYNIVLGYEDVGGVDPVDLILTQTFLDDYSKSVETGTPILTQPVINNVVNIGSVSAGPHRIDIRWEKNTSDGNIYIKKADMIIIAYEE